MADFYIDTDFSGGSNDGSESNPWVSLSAAISGLPTLTEDTILHYTGTTEDTTAVLITGVATTYKLSVIVDTDDDSYHGGVNGSACSTIKPVTGNAIDIRDSDVLISGLKIDTEDSGTYGIYTKVGTGVIFDNILLDNRNSNQSVNYCYSGVGTVLQNSIVLLGSFGYINGAEITCRNVTVYGSSINRAFRDCACYNCIAAFASTTYNAFYNCSGDYNCSIDNTAPGTHSVQKTLSEIDFTSITAGSEDLHISSTSDVCSSGVDLSTYFTTDIDGDTRSNWDIGADEYTASGSTLSPIKVNAGLVNSSLTVPRLIA